MLTPLQYKSFSRKIANLSVRPPPSRCNVPLTPPSKIDPVRKVRNYVDDEETTTSFFKSSFDNWVELNLSTTFTQYVRETSSLCDSFPLILHNKDRIFEILYTYIDKRDSVSLEPLLDLLAQLAHDLGVKFEPYLERSVALLSNIVSKHVDVQTIEWTFNCLAYLLKYLSKLLVPDLKPIYEILAPLLGREHQKPFVVRFAAEALSFLIRKSKGESLRLIVAYAFEDLENADRPGASAYAHGLMTMFNEACISVDRTTHSRGSHVFGMMLEVVLATPDSNGGGVRVIQGVLTALIHHTSRDTFQPMATVVLDFIKSDLVQGSTESRKVEMAARLLYTCVSVRKGGRIKDWSVVGDSALSIVEAAHRIPLDDTGSKEAMWQTLKAVAVVLHSAEVDVVISKCSRIVEKAKDFQVWDASYNNGKHYSNPFRMEPSSCRFASLFRDWARRDLRPLSCHISRGEKTRLDSRFRR